ncbi:MAG TPA: glycosyltransferase family 39 protein, partial [Candidatus Polarisedimenticolia bacterium]|nr:glycosyltransferase family 39 protein [Candidatus Polarisedimenticolia bacterium]
MLVLVLAAAAAFLLWRGGSMARAHSESYDDEYHLVHGAAYFRGGLGTLAQPDPPLGEALTALPMVLTNTNPRWTGALYDHSRPPEWTLFWIALWRSLLFLPAVGVAFAWCRRLYGLPAGLLAAALLVAEPNFAAHIPVAALDALGVVGALAGSWLLWRAFERPSFARGAGAAAGCAAALLLKGTTILLPVVAAAYAILFWVVRPRRIARQPAGAGTTSWTAALPRRLAALAGFAALSLLVMWVLLLFDVSRPDQPAEWQQAPTVMSRLLDRPLPGGIFIGSLVRGAWHAEQGHLAYLLGERSRSGWWYYFPVVMAYKAPLGVALVLLLALLSLRSLPPRFDEWGLAVPALLWTALFLTTRINIGVRHFLPAYVFLLLLGSRALAGSPPRWRTLAAWTGAA